MTGGQASSIISPETVVTSESGSLESVAPVTGISCSFTEHRCTEPTLFEQWRAAARLCQVRSCLPMIFHCGYGNSKVKCTSAFLFLRRNEGEEIWKGRESSLKRLLMLRQHFEPLNHAAHVTGPLCSCHCTQPHMHDTHWLVSNAAMLTCGPHLEDVIQDFM